MDNRLIFLYRWWEFVQELEEWSASEWIEVASG